MSQGTGRFDYVKYDDLAQEKSAAFKRLFQDVESFVERNLVIDPNMPKEHAAKVGRARALVLTKIEEAYMWVGKAIRDDQVARNGGAPLQEERNNE